MENIAIIGFGFCGITTLYNLVFQNKYKEITIFERSGISTLGTAFSKFSPHYILNVKAGKMSAFETMSDDFLQFLNHDYPNLYNKDSFVPRYIYGEYLQLIKEDAFLFAKKHSIKINIVEEEVLEIRKSEKEFIINTKSTSHQVNKIVLATSFKQAEIKTDLDNNFIKKLWSKDYLYFHQEDFFEKNIIKNIFIIGAGLSAVDVLIGLNKRNFSGKIFVMSRRGNLPRRHLNTKNNLTSMITTSDAKEGILFIAKKIRKFLKENSQYHFSNVIDSLRENTIELWQNLDAKNKKLFLKFLPYWNIYRHHAPVESLDIIDSMLKSGQIKIVKGSLKDIKNFQADLFINCLGFEFNIEKYPLLNQMCKENLLKRDIFMCQSNDENIHLIGGLNIGRDFESTSVPELRKQVSDVVNLL